MDTQDKLIKIFSRTPCEDVKHQDYTSEFRLPEYDDVMRIPDFNECLLRVQTIKGVLEKIESDYEEKEDQILQCLAELKTCRKVSRYLTEEFKVTKSLIKKTIYREWGNLKSSYDIRLQVIEEWNDIFISYTNRDAISTNRANGELIQQEWGADVDTATVKRNYVAKAIAKFFEQGFVRGWVDYNKLECGDDIGEAILKHAARSLAFVQILEPAIFVEPEPPERNWCLEEFNAFVSTGAPNADRVKGYNRCRFFAARGPKYEHVFPAAHPLAYGDWIDQAKPKLGITLSEYKTPFDDLQAAVRDIARRVLEEREMVLDAMLGSLD